MRTLCFHPRFIASILHARKRATARAIRHAATTTLALEAGERCLATRSDTLEPFATLRVVATEDRAVRAIDQTLATIEDHESPASLKQSLRGFYPSLQPSDVLRVIYFSCEGPVRCEDHASPGGPP